MTKGSHEYRPIRFLAMAVAWSWACWGISAGLATVEGREGSALLLNFLGLLGPTLAALVVIFTSGDEVLKRDFVDRLVNLRRIDPRYLIVTVTLPPLVMGLALWISLGLGQSSDQFAPAAPIDQLLPLIVLAMIIAPVMEELGWRGYGMDSLRAKTGMLGASLLFGVVWSLWHAPLVLIRGTYHYELAHAGSADPLVNFFVSVVVTSVLVSWLYYKHDRSIIAGVLLHAVLNAAAILPDATQATKSIVTVLYAVVAVALVLGDRRMLAEGPRSFLSERR